MHVVFPEEDGNGRTDGQDDYGWISMSITERFSLGGEEDNGLYGSYG